MKALILNKKVIDIKDKEFPVSSECKWVDCDDEKLKLDGIMMVLNLLIFDVTETTPTDEEIASQVRSDRSLLLQQSDWTQMVIQH